MIVRKGCESSVEARAATSVAQRLLRTPTPAAASVLRPTGFVAEVKLVPPTKLAESCIPAVVVKTKLHILACDQPWGYDAIASSNTGNTEYNHDDKFRHLCYTASLTARSRTVVTAPTKLTRRAAKIIAAKPNLRDCSVSIVANVLAPKTVYHFAFGKTTVAVVEETERGYGGIIRQSFGVARDFLWNVLAGSLEYDGLGALQLAAEVTKARLCQFQSMITSSASADCSVAMAMVRLAQRWCGSSTPVNMLGVNELHLLEPLEATAPLAAHLVHELRGGLGYKMAVGWVVRPPAAGDKTISHARSRRHRPHGGGDSAAAALAPRPQRDGGVRTFHGRRHHAPQPLCDEPGGASTALRVGRRPAV